MGAGEDAGESRALISMGPEGPRPAASRLRGAHKAVLVTRQLPESVCRECPIVCVCVCIGVCACVCGVFVQRDLCAYVLDTESHMLAHSLCITYFYDSSFFRIFILSRAPRVFNCLT